ncbi:hypothetical protein KGA66_10815 [Actinocrinis puniceicyclus]|uniref:Fucose-specific lectin n=1 Tax=Actinocrinis puniceicyclus TaxID=977794 RepID=A0A8J7WQ89_9ACTN|nr:hypothetical protein [Actinocrinis puniceicyclus]MBS2963540.1 hypothetical protein [Actinocrinis puniceicyclus]
MGRVGGQLAAGLSRAPNRLHVFHIDSGGVLRCAVQDGGAWTAVALPQADGLPFGTDLHPPGALMTGYQARGAQLDVFAVDRDGMLRVYVTPEGRTWQADVVPDAVGIPPGACIATGYQSGGSVLDVFVVGRSGEPLVFQGTDDGRWYSRRVPLDPPLPHGSNVSTGYLDERSRLALFGIDRAGRLQAVVETGDAGWRVEAPDARLLQEFELPPGAPLATGYPGGGSGLVLFTVDVHGRLCSFRRERFGWDAGVLPGAGLHAPSALATGYRDGGRQLLVFLVDDDGRLRQYAQEPDGSWSVGLVPGGAGLPPGAAVTTGYHADTDELEVFVLAGFSEPPIYYAVRGGGWTGPHRI